MNNISLSRFKSKIELSKNNIENAITILTYYNEPNRNIKLINKLKDIVIQLNDIRLEEVE